jgi:hypothetical protein
LKILLQITICCDFRSTEHLCKESPDVESTSQVNEKSIPVPKTTDFGFSHPDLELMKVCEEKFPVI